MIVQNWFHFSTEPAVEMFVYLDNFKMYPAAYIQGPYPALTSTDSAKC